MAEASADHLYEAFLEPIRFALLIDDAFPNYATLVEDAGAPTRAKGSHVVELTELCRSRGWLCDVESDLQVIRDVAPHLSQSDLAIVDFHLNPDASEDPTDAIRLLQRLAKSPHFNLAIVYTQVDVSQAALDVAFSLGAGTIYPAKLLQDGGDALDDVRAVEEAVATESVIAALMAADLTAEPVVTLRERWAKVVGGKAMKALFALYDAYFRTRLKTEVWDYRPPDATVEFDHAGAVPWVSADNLFVAFVNKSEDASTLIDRLHAALRVWDPPALRLLMVHARAALEKAGTQHDAEVLHSELRQAGWLYNVFAAAPDERPRRIGELYGHLFESMATQLQTVVGQFGASLFGQVAKSDALTAAREWGRVDGQDDGAHVLHAANEFLSSRPCDETGRLTTGLVFRAKVGKGEMVWVCTTPSCDLVPGQNDKGWDSQMAPFKAVYAARLQPQGAADLGAILAEANNGRHLFLTVDGKPVALEVAASESRQARLEVLFVADEGRYDGRIFKGFVIRQKEGAPTLEAVDFEALAQLRPGYANKFLMDAGMQKARIGLAWAAPVAPPAPEAAHEAVEVPAPAPAEAVAVAAEGAPELERPATAVITAEAETAPRTADPSARAEAAAADVEGAPDLAVSPNALPAPIEAPLEPVDASVRLETVALTVEAAADPEGSADAYASRGTGET